MQRGPLLDEVLADAVASLLGGVKPTAIEVVELETERAWGSFNATLPDTGPTGPVGFIYAESTTEPCKITFLQRF